MQNREPICQDDNETANKTVGCALMRYHDGIPEHMKYNHYFVCNYGSSSSVLHTLSMALFALMLKIVLAHSIFLIQIIYWECKLTII